MMKVQYIVLYLSALFWIFPAVRQYKTELFWYFLVFALSDPIRLILIIIFRTNPSYITLLLNILLLFSVIWQLLKKSSKKAVLFVVSTLFIYSFFTSRIFAINLALLFHIIIIFYFVQRSLSFITKTDKVNIFHLFLLLEEISIVLKVLAVLSDAKTGLAFHTATNLFQILIAIFFTLYKEDDSKLFISLRNV